jgi:flagellar protein FlaJ
MDTVDAGQAGSGTKHSERPDRARADNGRVTAGGRPVDTDTRRVSSRDGAGSLSLLDRALYALFARHADERRHERDRRRYRGTDLQLGFDLYLARTYGLAWLAGLLALVGVVGLGLALPATAFDLAGALLTRVLPVDPGTLPVVPRVLLVGVAAVGGGVAARRTVLTVGGLYLRWRAAGRGVNVERTLPGAVRYLHVLSTGSDSAREMLRKVAATDSYGATAVAFRKALNTAALTGSLDEGLRRVARDTPSQDLLAPFLLKFSEHADQGADALSNYLRMESRMLGHRQDRARDRAEGFLELLSELFMVTLVFPALLMIILTVMSILVPGLSETVTTPLGPIDVRGLVIYAGAGFVLLVGVGASIVVAGVRPPDQTIRYERPASPTRVFGTATTNPASAAVVAAGPALALAAGLALAGTRLVHVTLAAYVVFAVPVGLVALRRAHRDDAKDREMKDFVHAVSGHVSLGRPFSRAVAHVSQDVDLGPLNDDVADLAANLSFTVPEGQRNTDARTAALDRFVAAVGTPLAEQTVGLVTGALDGGSDTSTVFDTLQTEIGRLYHQKRALRSSLLVYVAVGWTTALLVVGITVAVAGYIFDGFAQLTAVGEGSAYVIQAGAVDVAREQFRIYVVAQATMLAAGWFAGTASRGRFEALLHSGVLVTICYVVYAGMGLI